MVSATWTTYSASMPWFRMGYVYAAVCVAACGMLLVLMLDIYERAFGLAQGRAGVAA